MRKSLLLSFGIALILVIGCSCNQNDRNADTTAKIAEQEIAEVSVDSLLLSPRSFENRRVRVAGIVEHVCVHTGQRLTLLGKSSEMKLRVVASDAAHPFDLSLKGKKVEVTGYFKRVEGPSNICEAETAHHPGEIYFLDCQNVKDR